MPKQSEKQYTEFFLVRHFPTEANLGILRFQGQTLDLPITADGKRDSRKLGKNLPKDIRLVVHSPAKRAVETMRGLSLGREPELEIREEPRLAERDFGLAEGKTRKELIEALSGKIPKPLEEELRKNIGNAQFVEKFDQLFGKGPVGGESFARLRARTRETLLQLAEENPGKKLVLVTHGGWINAALVEALNLSGKINPYRIATGSITVVRVKNKRITLSRKPTLEK